MPVPKGTRIGGRQKGTPNKNTAEIKEMIIQALSNKGGVTYLERQADENPTAFMTLVGKVLPMQVTGEGGGPVRTRIEIAIVDPKGTGS